MIKLENVSKSFKNKVVFRNLNVEISGNKIIQIIGENGSGKSVLLKLIAGFSHPDSGMIKVDDEIIGDKYDFIQNAGIIINSPEFMGDYSGLENLRYLANIKKVSNDDDIKRLCEHFGMLDDIHKKYKTYSLGTKQKMRFIQAFLDKPKYLLLDEPYEALDRKTRCLVSDYLKNYIADDKDRMLIFVSHIPVNDLLVDETYEVCNHSLKRLDNCTLF